MLSLHLLLCFFLLIKTGKTCINPTNLLMIVKNNRHTTAIYNSYIYSSMIVSGLKGLETGTSFCFPFAEIINASEDWGISNLNSPFEFV